MLAEPLRCLQLPVKMVRCGQHATLAVQLAASPAPHWGRKSSSFVAAPPIAEEEAGAGACSGSASPRAAVAADGGSCPGSVRLPMDTPTCAQDSQAISLPGENGTPLLQNGAAQNGSAPVGEASAGEGGLLSRGVKSEGPHAANGSRVGQSLPTHASDVFREQQPCRRPAQPLQGSMVPESCFVAQQTGASAADPKADRYIEGRVGSSCVKLAQLHPAGSMAAQSHMLSDSAGAIPELTPICAVKWSNSRLLHYVQRTGHTWGKLVSRNVWQVFGVKRRMMCLLTAIPRRL